MEYIDREVGKTKGDIQNTHISHIVSRADGYPLATCGHLNLKFELIKMWNSVSLSY